MDYNASYDNSSVTNSVISVNSKILQNYKKTIIVYKTNNMSKS